MSPRILVIGFGFLGAAIAATATSRGLATRTLTRSKPASTGPWDVVIGDASDRSIVLPLARDVDHVIYAAGRSLPSVAEADPAADLAQSIGPLLAVIDACREGRCSLTLLSSGGAVYGNAVMLPISECHPTNPISAYGSRNLMAEKHTAAQADRFGINLRIFRISNVYGICQKRRPSQGIIPALLHSAKDGKPVTIYGDGRAIRDYIHIPDVASAVIDALALPPNPRIINLGSGQGHSTLDLVAMCNAVTGREIKLHFDQARAFDVTENVLDVRLLRRLMPFNPLALETAMRQIWHRMTEKREEHRLQLDPSPVAMAYGSE